MIPRQRLLEFVRYVATGLLGLTLNAGGVVLLTEVVGLHYLLSLTFVSALVVVVGFFLSKFWTFQQRGTAAIPELLRYVLTTATNMAIGIACCALLVELFGIPYTWSVVLVGIGFAPITYLAHRGWTFGLPWMCGK